MISIRDKSVRYLTTHVEEILSKQNAQGEFWPDHGRPARWNTDYQQFAYYPLAFLFTLDHLDNPWKNNPRLLAAVERSLANNLAIQADDGRFWQSSHDLPPSLGASDWRIFTWLRTWELVKDKIDPELSRRCQEGLQRAIVPARQAAQESVAEQGFCENHNVRNHPVWSVVALYALARHLGQSEAEAWAQQVLERICAAQHPAGIWLEHGGPAAVYQFLTMCGLSHYLAMSSSAAARQAIKKASDYYRVLTYPAGHPVETLDARARYTGYVLSMLPSGWAHWETGRGQLHWLIDKLLTQPLGPAHQTHGGWLGLPFFTQFIRDLPADADFAQGDARVGEGVHEIDGLSVRVIQRGPWMVVLSGVIWPERPENRWVLDCQQHLSVFHEKKGLILGGGNSKRQAALSTFSSGGKPLGLACLASAGRVETLGPAAARVILEYPGFRAVLDANIQPDRLELAARVEKAQETPEVYLQLPFLMKGPEEIVTGTGGRYSTEDQQEISPQAMGSTIGREGKFTLRGVEGGRALLYLLPYNTHWRTGWSPPEKAVGVVAVPVGAGRTISVVASGG